MADEKRGLSFWHGKRVLVTGHTGFIGSWLSYWLSELGAQVAGYALAPHTTPSLYDALQLDGRVISHIGDIADQAALGRVLDQHQPEIVLHLAAQAIVGAAHADAVETWRVNTLGTVALLAALRGRDVRALGVFTTDKVYDNLETGQRHREGDAIGGFGIYDSSKGAAELAVRAFAHGGLLPPTAVLRAGNVVGGGDWSESRLAPDCARAFAASVPVTLRHPESVRPWQHVLDACYATLQLMAALYEAPKDFAGAWNIGPAADGVLKAAEVAERMAQHWGQKPAWQPSADAAAFPEAAVLLLDSSKLATALGWVPKLGADDIFAWTASWYRDYDQNPTRAAQLTAAQIAAFTQRLKDAP